MTDLESPIMDEREAAVRTLTLKNHRDVLSCIEQLLNAYIEGFRAMGRFTETDENKREQVWLWLLTKSFNSLRWAYHLLQLSYYTQSLILIRSAYEDWLVCIDCIGQTATVDAALGIGRRGLPSIRDMARRLDEPLRSEWQGADSSYNVLSNFAHPHRRSIYAAGNVETRTIRVGPDYDKAYFLFTAHYLIMAGVRMTEFLSRITDPKWAEDKLAKAQAQAIECGKKVGEQGSSLLASKDEGQNATPAN